jgi:hypothetical protein
MMVRELQRHLASFDFAQDEGGREWHLQTVLILSEVEGRTMRLQSGISA